MDRADLAVAQWARERPELDGLPMAVLGRLQQAAHIVTTAHLNPLFARAGLQPGEFDVMATLRRSGAPCTLSPTALYEAAMISSGAMTNRLDRLETAGLVERLPDPNDRRGRLVALTAKGLALIDDTIGAHVENEKQVLSGLSPQEQETLNGLLRKLIASLA